MPYLFTCPHCQTQTQVEDRYSGQSGQCVNCGNPIQLPEFGRRVADPSVETPAARSAPVRWIAGAIVSLIIMACLVFAVIQIGSQSISRVAASRDRSMSIRNLQRIAEALNAYAADHGSYPPVATTDDSGRSLHSWRVLILPYLGEEILYNEIDLSVAWDDPINTNVARRMPSVYQHPNASQHNLDYQSGYHLVTGPGTLFPVSGPLGPADIVDDPAQTIVVIEAKPTVLSGLWTEPVEVDYDKMQGNIGGNPNTEVGGLLVGGVAMATADGRGHFLPDTTDPSILRSLITPRGGERLPDDTLD